MIVLRPAVGIVYDDFGLAGSGRSCVTRLGFGGGLRLGHEGGRIRLRWVL